jgi:hypothetical protein
VRNIHHIGRLQLVSGQARLALDDDLAARALELDLGQTLRCGTGDGEGQRDVTEDSFILIFDQPLIGAVAMLSSLP